MSIEYAESKVQEALDLSGGNKAKASKLLMEWIYADYQLLLGLTGIHLGGIVPYWVHRVAAKDVSMAKKADKKARVAAQKQSKKTKSFGEEMLRTFAGQRSATFGLEAGSVPIRKKAASQRHVDTIKFLAKNRTED